MAGMRRAIFDDNLQEFAKEFYAQYGSNEG